MRIMITHRTADRLGRHILLTMAALGMVACAGGGGGGGASTPDTTVGNTVTPVSPPPPPPPPPPGPSASSAEFTRNYQLGSIHADAAYTAGASGAGITVAVLDTGVDGSTSELAGRVSSRSSDANTSRNTPVGTDPHGSWVAGVIASNFDNQGTVGVAYASTILSVRVDTAPGNCGGDTCISSNLAASAIDYAIAQGAKVVNMSFGEQTGPQGSAFEAALLRGVRAGLVFTVSAGNEANNADTWPAIYAIDPRFTGSIIVAGASTATGALASFSNTAAGAANLYIVAPGSRIITGCNNGAGCSTVSGTSFSAPAVAGSLALLLQAFPNLSGKQALDLLLRTADDLGALGTDSTYGRGALNLARAFAPVGAVAVAQASGAAVSISASPGSYVSTAIGDAFAKSDGLRTAGRDSYNRLFAVNLAQSFRASGASIIAAEPASITRSSDINLPSFAQGTMHVSAALANGAIDPADHFHWMLSNGRSGDLSVSYERGGMSLAAWKGSGLANPFFAKDVDAFTAVAQPDQAMRAAFARGRFRFTAEAGSGKRLTPDRMQRQDGSHYFRAGGDIDFGGATTSLSAGELIEPLGPFGSYLPQASGAALPSRTGFVSASSRWTVAPGVGFSMQGSVGQTKLRGAFLSTTTTVMSSAWRLQLDGNCKAWGLACSGVRLSLSQPLRIEQGSFSAVLPDTPTDSGDPLTFSNRRFSASPSGREVDLRLRADRSMANWGVLSLEGVAARQPGNRADAPAAFGVLGGWRVAF